MQQVGGHRKADRSFSDPKGCTEQYPEGPGVRTKPNPTAKPEPRPNSALRCPVWPRTKPNPTAKPEPRPIPPLAAGLAPGTSPNPTRKPEPRPDQVFGAPSPGLPPLPPRFRPPRLRRRDRRLRDGAFSRPAAGASLPPTWGGAGAFSRLGLPFASPFGVLTSDGLWLRWLPSRSSAILTVRRYS